MSRFISFEGVEGAGKSTLMRGVSRWLEGRGMRHLCTREPGGCALGELVRHSVLHSDRIQPVAEAELLLMYAARIQHLRQTIEPALEQGHWVLCDRFHDASHAYQGAGRQLGEAAPVWLDHWLLDGRLPHLTFLLDLDVETGLERVRRRAEGTDRMERERRAFFERVRQGYLHRAEQEPERIVVLDATMPEGALLEQACGRLETWLR